MPTGRLFSARLSLPALVSAANSIGAHLAAKLGEFASDERTLTDELCDMFCIWSQLTPNLGSLLPADAAFLRALPKSQFRLDLRKTTAPEEANIGADLELAITTPAGTKTALLQAKVFDDATSSLRGSRRKDWDKLRTQLRDARGMSGDLAFLLLYVPSSLLRDDYQGYGTWEQRFRTKNASTGRSSRYGTMFFPVNDLLDGRDRWYSRSFANRVNPLKISPAPLCFSEVVLEMLACRRGRWVGGGRSPMHYSESTVEPVRQFPYRRLDLRVGEFEDTTFERFSGQLA